MRAVKLSEDSFALRAVLLAGTVLAATPALAQSAAGPPKAPSATLEEIIVTAQKREQNLQSVPVSITALTESALVANRVADVRDINGLVPNLTVRQGQGAPFPIYSVRGVVTSGVAPGQDKGVSLYLDGVYLQNTLGSIFDLADIERIEVLKGPQGTLFGRNSTGGAISIITRDPTGEFGVRQELTAGNYDQFRSKTRIDLPALGPFSAAVTYLHSQRNGDVRNLGAGTQWNYGPATNGKLGILTSPKHLGDHDIDSVSAAIKFRPSDKFDLSYKFDYAADHFTPEAYAPAALNTALLGPAGGLINGLLATQPNPANLSQITKYRPRAVNNAFTVPGYTRNDGHNFTAQWRPNDYVSFKDILSFRKNTVRVNVQLDGIGGLVNTSPFLGPVGAPFLMVASTSSLDERQWSNEAQVNVDTQWFHLTAGAIHFHDVNVAGPVGQGTSIIIFGTVPNFVIPNAHTLHSRVVSVSDAIYAQPEIHLSSKLDFVAGLRETRDTKKGVDNASLAIGPLPIDYKNSRPTYLLGLNYKANSDTFLYAKYSTGYISGGELGTLKYSPETSESYEGGVKLDLLDRRLRTNLAVFHAEYTGLQYATAGLQVGLPQISQVIVNGGNAKADGFELETTTTPLEGLTVTANVGYTNFHYTSVNLALSSSISAYLPVDRPKWTTNLAVQYQTPELAGGTHVLMRADMSYQSKQHLSYNLSTPQTFENTTVGHNFLLNGRIALTDLKLAGATAEVALWGRNLTNNRNPTTDIAGNFIFSANFQPARTFGVDLNFNF
jgi:iron complex outermembrane receptor protein